MSSPYRTIEVQNHGAVCCIRFKQNRLDDNTIRAVSDEIESLVHRERCHGLILSLGEISCLYSLLIAKLIKMKRLMSERQGVFKLCNVSPEVMEVLVSCQLHNYFEFAPDCDAAVKALAQHG